jgi:hypothetical protein
VGRSIPVAVPHRYSDRVAAYRIYRSGPSEPGLSPLGMSTELRFVDRTVESGGTCQYAVTGIREQHVDGTNSYPSVAISVP